ncbi:hypothetical protein X975_05301, partial [Stegodyphus mimosarum]
MRKTKSKVSAFVERRANSLQNHKSNYIPREVSHQSKRPKSSKAIY